MDKKRIKEEIKVIKNIIKDDLKKAEGREQKKEVSKYAYKKFDIIYEKYGQGVYTKYVPNKYRKNDITELLKEKRFLSLLNKHGQNTFYRYENYIMQSDILYESKNSRSIIPYKIKNEIWDSIKLILMPILIGVPAVVGSYQEVVKIKEKKENLIQIEEYLNDANNFGKDLKSYNLTDLQNYMFIMDDMWSNIKGYKEPQKNLISYPGLDLATPEGYGVCRNMADDVAIKLNAVDERYNARTITVYAVDGDYTFNDIDVKIVPDDENKKIDEQSIQRDDSYRENSRETATNVLVEKQQEFSTEPVYGTQSKVTVESQVAETQTKEATEVSVAVPFQETSTEVQSQSPNEEEKTFINKITERVFGNHMVVLCDSIEDDIQIVLDPTNPGIGIMENGNIIMFNSSDENPIYKAYTFYGSAIRGLDGIAQIPENYIKSTKKISDSKMEYLRNKYSVEEQNKAIAQVREKKPRSFYSRMRVDSKTTEHTGTDIGVAEETKSEKDKDDFGIR